MHDTHAHLEMLLQRLDVLTLQDREEFDPQNLPTFPNSILDNLLASHHFIIQATTSTKNFLLTYQLLSYNPKIKFIIGSHPELISENFDVDGYLREQKELLEQNGFLKKNEFGDLILNTGETDEFGLTKIVGIGECGLDYHYTQDKNIIRKQWQLFEAQMSLACFLNQPIALHTRDSFVDTFAIVQKFPQIKNKFVFHCFSEGVWELEKVLDFGGYISVGGILTFKNAQKLVEVVKVCPIDRLMVETDLPFLAPTPHRGKTCLPEYVDFVAHKIAEIKGINPDQIWDKLAVNTINFWKFKAV